MGKTFINQLGNMIGAILIALATVGMASAQTPAGTSLTSLNANQVAMAVGAGNRSGTLRISVAHPDSTGRVAIGRSDSSSLAAFSSAGFSDVRPFGHGPIRLDAQVGTDIMSPSVAMLNPVNANEAWKALIGYQWRALNVKAGVNQIYTNFTSPSWLTKVDGDQNRLGGTELDSSYSLTPNLMLTAGGQFYDGRFNTGQQLLLGANDRMNQANVGVRYGISSRSSVELGYEWVQWDLNNSEGSLNATGKPTEQYITIGLGRNLSKNTAFKLLYQIVDYKDDGTGFSNATLPNNGNGAVVGQANIAF